MTKFGDILDRIYDVVLNENYEKYYNIKYLYLIILLNLFIYLITSYFYLILLFSFFPHKAFLCFWPWLCTQELQ